MARNTNVSKQKSSAPTKKPSRLSAVGDKPLDLQYIEPTSLKGNPANWRIHPQRQRQAYQGLHNQVGWAGALLINRTTGNLLDGHMRLEESIRRGDKSVPVLVGEWSPEQERLILQNLDPLTMLAQTNAAALSSLAKQSADAAKTLEKQSKVAVDKALKDLGRDLSTYAAKVKEGEAPSILLERVKTRDKSSPEKVDAAGDDEDQGSVRDNSLKDDVLFPTENAWGIPELREDMLSTVVPRSVWDRSNESVAGDAWYCYSAGPSTLPASSERQGGILGFFTEDFRFEGLWNDTPRFTERLISEDWGGVCLPDYSTWASWPFALRLHNLYRSRWLGRYWQEAGIPVIPILQSIGDTPAISENDEDVGLEEICLATLPAHIPVAAMQVRTAEKQDTDYWEAIGDFLQSAISMRKIDHLVIYGGLEYQKYLAGNLGRVKSGFKGHKTQIVLLDSFVTKRRNTQMKKQMRKLP